MRSTPWLGTLGCLLIPGRVAVQEVAALREQVESLLKVGAGSHGGICVHSRGRKDCAGLIAVRERNSRP